MIRTIPIYIVAICLIISCKPRSTSVFAGMEALGFLNDLDYTVYYLPGAIDTVLHALDVMQTHEGYSVIIDDTSYAVNLMETSEIEEIIADYVLLMNQAIVEDSTEMEIVYPGPQFGGRVVRKNARCNLFIPAKRGRCRPTFGRHRKCGTFMIRLVNAYTACRRGDTLCVENLRIVGGYTYYLDNNCTVMSGDSCGFVIRRWACN